MSNKLIDNKEVMKEWDYKKNNDIKIFPETLTTGSNKKVWWICNQKHSYEATIYDRFSGQGCPYCSNNKVLKGYNDFATKHPEQLKEWDYEKNKQLGITPETITNCRRDKVWWICKNGHEYQRLVQNQRKGSGKCPICKSK